MRVAGRWGANGARVANYTTPGTWTRYGSFSDTFSFTTAPFGGSLPLHLDRDRVTAFRLRRLAVPLPSFLTSVNQIGFDSYVLLVGAVAVSPPDSSGRGRVLLWAMQAHKGAHGVYVADPHGTLVFPLAGYYRGSADLGLSGAINVVLSVPALPLAMVLGGFLQASVWFVIAVLSAVSWTGTARVIRAEFLSLREREYVLAARAMGRGDVGIIVRHMLPNVLGTVIVAATPWLVIRNPPLSMIKAVVASLFSSNSRSSSSRR